jgi:phage gp45-like
MRSNVTNAARHAQMNMSRATVREFDDAHLLQEVKQADVFHSETPSNFERFQMVGLTSMPLKQADDEQQQKQQQQTQDDGFNHNQPKGKAAEAIMLYPGGRSHPIAIVDDRRVRPYGMNPGEGAFYAASGTGQMLFHNDAGSYLVSVNNPSEEKDAKEKERFASLRHVTKKKQPREIKEGQKVDDPKHEGETVNLEIRTTSKRIEFRAGDQVVGYYDKEGSKWVFLGKVLMGGEDESKMRKVHRQGDIDSNGDTAETTAQQVYAV